MPKTNIVLIGMPGVGKSTVGVLLAKAAGYGFIDTDVLIQTRCGCALPELIARRGIGGLCDEEERCVLSLDCRRTVIATGGSVVYRDAAMERLAAGGRIVHLAASFEVIRGRVGDMEARGVVKAPHQTLRHLYDERMPMYRRWAEVTICVDGMSQQETMEAARSRTVPA